MKKTRLPAGGVRKMSLAVLVDQDVTWEPAKGGMQRVLVPPSPEKIKVIRDLVAGITGFNAERGDQLVIETLPFESTLQLEPPPSPATPAAPPPAAPLGIPLRWDRKTIIIAGSAAAGLLLLLLAGLWLRSKRRRPGKSAELTGAPALAEGQEAGDTPALDGASAGEDIEAKLAERDAMQQKIETQTLNSLILAPVITKKAEVLAKHLREKIAKEPEISAQILRTWIREEES